MKKLIIFLMLFFPLLGHTQSHVFTEEQVVQMDSLFQVYEQTDTLQKLEIKLLTTQLDNYKTLHKQDSLHLMYLEENIVLLNRRIDLYIDLTKELEPKWYKRPGFQFVLGAATIITSSWVVSNIK